jgi:SAM-dependent methyltransferase
MVAQPNTYSRRWFEFFHIGIGEARTIQEATFVCRCAPLPDFRKLADVCCGMGRHARALSSRGYSVTGIDRDSDAIAKARELAGGPSYVHADIRDYRPAPGAFDVAIIMGQSFGHFDPTTNRDVLGRLAAGLRAGGRVILDLWNHEFSPLIRTSVNSRRPAEWFERANVWMAIGAACSWITRTVLTKNSNGNCSRRRK